jgi:DNA polymerase
VSEQNNNRNDYPKILASLRDYVEQLREEGVEGLPAGELALTNEATMQSGGSGMRERSRAEISPESGSSSAGRVTTSSKVDGAPGLYAGIEETTDLSSLRAFIGNCQRCKLAPGRTNLVFGVGNPNAELVFVGEAPGADEDAKGEPFVGRAGQLLTDIIERGMRLSRSDVYICNVIKCRPPGNRNPEPDEVASCEPFLLRQIQTINPKVIVGLGTFAVQALLKVKTPISRLRGNWHDWRGIKMMPTFHPAYLLRNPGDKRLVWSDIQQVMRMLGYSVEGGRN